MENHDHIYSVFHFVYVFIVCFSLLTVGSLHNPSNNLALKPTFHIIYISTLHIQEFVSGNFTIFAPTDAAFGALGTDAELTKDTAKLAELLKYHVVAGSIPSSAAKNELELDTLAGTKLRFNIYHHNQVS